MDVQLTKDIKSYVKSWILINSYVGNVSDIRYYIHDYWHALTTVII